MVEEIKRIYSTLNVGMFIFVEDDFAFNENNGSKAHILLDFARMNEDDRTSLINEIPNDDPRKKALVAYAEALSDWIYKIDWENAPRDDVEHIIKTDPVTLGLYNAIEESLWEGELKKSFLRYGVGIRIPDIFEPLFSNVIRSETVYLPTRIYTNYIEEIHQEILTDLKSCKNKARNAVLVLDNKVGDTRIATQMIEDLKNRDIESSCSIYASIFSTAGQALPTESCETPELYIGYTNKTEKLDGLHTNIIRAAINILIQQYRDKYLSVFNGNCDLLSKNPDLVEYLYCMAKEEGEPGYDLIQEWISFMTSHDMEESNELVQLMKISNCIDAYDSANNFNLKVPPELIKAANSENFLPSVNKYCSIPSPGDIFKYRDRLYILVGQDCDYMMGANRKRNAPLCELVPAELVDQQDVDKLDDDQKYVYINNYTDDDGSIYVLKADYSKRKIVCNEIINLCAFNNEGNCTIDLEHKLFEEVLSLLQPYMIEYYGKLRTYFEQIKNIRTKYPEYYTSMQDLNVAKPLVDITDFEENNNVINYGIKRVSRLKKTASLYLYKMFLEYRGRTPYTSINLTGFSSVAATIASGEKQYPTSLHIKLTNNRKKNRNGGKIYLQRSWYILGSEVEKAVSYLFGEHYSLIAENDYIEISLTQTVVRTKEGVTISLNKRIDDSDFFVDMVINHCEGT